MSSLALLVPASQNSSQRALSIRCFIKDEKTPKYLFKPWVNPLSPTKFRFFWQGQSYFSFLFPSDLLESIKTHWTGSNQLWCSTCNWLEWKTAPFKDCPAHSHLWGSSSPLFHISKEKSLSTRAAEGICFAWACTEYLEASSLSYSVKPGAQLTQVTFCL